MRLWRALEHLWDGHQNGLSVRMRTKDTYYPGLMWFGFTTRVDNLGSSYICWVTCDSVGIESDTTMTEIPTMWFKLDWVVEYQGSGELLTKDTDPVPNFEATKARTFWDHLLEG